jgi:cyanophycinase
MKEKKYKILLLLLLPLSLAGQGQLFIIGGGKRPPEMVREMVKLSGIGERGHAVVLTMASEEPDSSAFYARLQFEREGVEVGRIAWQHYQKGVWPAKALDSLRSAAMIYMTGGDQTRFMDVVLGTPIYDAIREAYSNGALIAGTSAGAAVMSRLMITGNERKYPEYTGNFRTIEAENIEIAEGLGLLPHAIVDQHFVYRMRMNRLITVALEHPGVQCFGVDEATALVISGKKARVVGEGQVVDLSFLQKGARKQNGLLGGKNLRLNIWLPGDRFSLRKSPLK